MNEKQPISSLIDHVINDADKEKGRSDGAGVPRDVIQAKLVDYGGGRRGLFYS